MRLRTPARELRRRSAGRYRKKIVYRESAYPDGPSASELIHNAIKSSAIIQAVYRTRINETALSPYLAARIYPYTYASGDFYWGRMLHNPNCVVVVVGDASGHDSYATTLSMMIGLVLDASSEERTATAAASDPDMGWLSAAAVLRNVGNQFADHMRSAAESGFDKTYEFRDQFRQALQAFDVNTIRSRLSVEGFDAVCLHLDGDRLTVCSAGLPCFVLFKDGRIEKCGAQNPGKNISAVANLCGLDDDMLCRADIAKIVIATDGIFDQETVSGSALSEQGMLDVIDANRADLLQSESSEALTIIERAIFQRYGRSKVLDDRLLMVLNVADLAVASEPAAQA